MLLYLLLQWLILKLFPFFINTFFAEDGLYGRRPLMLKLGNFWEKKYSYSTLVQLVKVRGFHNGIKLAFSMSRSWDMCWGMKWAWLPMYSLHCAYIVHFPLSITSLITYICRSNKVLSWFLLGRWDHLELQQTFYHQDYLWNHCQHL